MTLIYILFFLSIPVFYIIGIIEAVRSIGRKAPEPAPVHRDDKLDGVTAAKIRDLADEAPPELAVKLNALAAEIGGAVTGPVDHSHLIMPGDTVQLASPLTPPPAPTGLNRQIDVMHSLDNINVILYLGAFLVVVSAGIFVGVNYDILSGVFKTIFLGLFAAAFYAIGLYFFLNSRKLRPAGVTFTGTGLVLLPLVGLAAYNFTSLNNHGSATWFATSIITLAAYIATMIVTRQTYIAYLMAFTSLSLFESAISLLDLPVHWLGWGMAMVALLMLVVTRWRLFWEDADAAILISANIFLPLALLFSLTVIDSDGIGQLGITLGLAGVFYGAMANRFFGRPVAAGYWALALGLIPAAFAIGLWDSQPRSVIAAIMLALSGIYGAIEYMWGPKLPQRWRELQGLVVGLLPLAGIAVMYDNVNVVAAILAYMVVVNAVLALRLRQSSLGLLAILALLALPYVFILGVLDIDDTHGLIPALLLAEVPVLAWWARRLVDWPESGRAVGQAGYILALVLALVTAIFTSATTTWGVGLAAAAAWYILSLTERQINYVYVAAATLYLAMFQPGLIYQWEGAITSWLLLSTGAAVYAIGLVEQDSERSQALRYSGMMGPFLGALAGVFSSTPRLEPVLSLAVGGGLFWTEGKRQSEPIVMEAAGAIWVAALNWACIVWNVSQTQLYTLPWTAYFAVLAYRRRHEDADTFNGFIAVTLAFLTFPLGAQALAEDGQLYGLFLIIESIILVFIGIGLSNKLIRSWGIVALVVEVLYQMKDVFLALPKYLISAALGLVLLAIAIVLLQRRKGGE